MTDKEFSYPIRVYYEDTDAGGVVYYANYLRFFERARTEWLRHLKVEQAQLAASTSCIFVVNEVTVKYYQPARLDDLLNVKSKIYKLGAASINFEQRIEKNGQLLTLAKITVVSVSTINFKPMMMSQDLRALLQTCTSEKF